jgi:hypothetical protein
MPTQTVNILRLLDVEFDPDLQVTFFLSLLGLLLSAALFLSGIDATMWAMHAE